MPDTPAVTPAPTDHDDIPARQSLPGTRLIAYRLPACGIAGSYIHMDHADIHVTYTQVVGRAGEFPARTVGYGQRTVRGRDVNSFLRGNLNFWLSSDARMADDGVIRYRQTRNHSVVTFVPDKASGILINRPDEQVTAAAYRVTGPTGVTQLWRGQAVRDAIDKCRRKPKAVKLRADRRRQDVDAQGGFVGASVDFEAFVGVAGQGALDRAGADA